MLTVGKFLVWAVTLSTLTLGICTFGRLSTVDVVLLNTRKEHEEFGSIMGKRWPWKRKSRKKSGENGKRRLHFCGMGMKNIPERCGGEFWKAFLPYSIRMRRRFPTMVPKTGMDEDAFLYAFNKA